MSMDVRFYNFTDMKFRKLVDQTDGIITVLATVFAKETCSLAETESEVSITTFDAATSMRLVRAMSAFNAAMTPVADAIDDVDLAAAEVVAAVEYGARLAYSLPTVDGCVALVPTDAMALAAAAGLIIPRHIGEK